LPTKLSFIDQRMLYGGKLELPRPAFIVVYNGPDELADKTEQRLSDLFKRVAGHEGIELEVVVEGVQYQERAERGAIESGWESERVRYFCRTDKRAFGGIEGYEKGVCVRVGAG
jgi:hypothetical protein